MIQPIIENSYLVEINLGTVAAQKQINFNFIPQLEGSIIYSIQTFSVDGLAISPNGSAMVPTIGLTNITVTLSVGDSQDVYLYPCSDLFSPNVYGFQRLFANKKFNLTKSFITLQSVSSIANNQSILFLFHYRK
jgi:hypothetical protein